MANEELARQRGISLENQSRISQRVIERMQDGVLVVGCKEGECHYQRGTYLGRGKTALLGEILAEVGIAPERVQFAELGSLDRFALPRLISRMSAGIKNAVMAVA